MTTPESPDFFATLFIILTMQVMGRTNARKGAAWIGLCFLIMTAVLWESMGAEALALSIVFTGANILFGFFALTTRRAQEARIRNEHLAGEITKANNELSTFTLRQEELALARERNRLAREMHDSVTQTVFSMSLAAQSAGIMVARDPAGLEAQLKRLSSLSQTALSEMKLLVSELQLPEIRVGLEAMLRQYAQEHGFPGELKVKFEIEGEGALSPAEEEALFHIAREGLTNAGKHAGTAKATVRLILVEPFSLDIEDHGQGFDTGRQAAVGMGLKNMQEQAAEIGWRIEVISALGRGTRIWVEKNPPAGG